MREGMKERKKESDRGICKDRQRSQRPTYREPAQWLARRDTKTEQSVNLS